MPIDVWDRDVALADLVRQDIWRLRREFLERMFPAVGSWKVLESGSGPAHDSLTFAERGARVTALDYSINGLAAARRIYDELNLGLDPVRGDAIDLPFPNGTFDLAFNAGVLEHFTDKALGQVISEMIRVVRPGGYVLAFCPNRYNVYYQVHLHRVHQHRYDYERAFSAGELRRRFQAQGLVDVRSSGVHVHPAVNYLLPGWLPKHHWIEPISRWSFSWFERLEGLDGLKSLVGQDTVVWGRVPGICGRATG